LETRSGFFVTFFQWSSRRWGVALPRANAPMLFNNLPRANVLVWYQMHRSQKKKYGFLDLLIHRRFTSGVPTHHAAQLIANCDAAHVHASRSCLCSEQFDLRMQIFACGHSRSEIKNFKPW
jgi:hypothetical protein